MPVAMTKKERELRQKFTQKKQEASNLLDEGKSEEARSMLDEAKALQRQIELMSEERGLELPALDEERNFVPELERKPFCHCYWHSGILLIFEHKNRPTM